MNQIKSISELEIPNQKGVFMILTFMKLYANPLFPIFISLCTFLWFGIALAVDAAANSVDSPLSITVSTNKQFFRVGETILLQIRIANQGTNKLCMIGYEGKSSDTPEAQYNIKLSLVSGNVAVPPIYKHAPDQKFTVVTLEPQETREFSINLNERYGELQADQYVALARYKHKKNLAQTDRLLREQGCQYWPKAAFSNHTVIKIEALDQQAEIRRWLSQWRGEGVERKWRALLWLKDNVIKEGMIQDRVRELLGDPSSFYSDGSWIYRVGLVGISISFTNGIVERVSQIEG